MAREYVVVENAGCDEESEVMRTSSLEAAYKFASRYGRKARNPACVDVMAVMPDGSFTTEI